MAESGGDMECDQLGIFDIFEFDTGGSAGYAKHAEHSISVPAMHEFEHTIVAKEMKQSKVVGKEAIIAAVVERVDPNVVESIPTRFSLRKSFGVDDQQQMITQLAAKVDALIAMCATQSKIIETIAAKCCDMETQINTVNKLIPCVISNTTNIVSICSNAHQTSIRVDDLMSMLNFIVSRVVADPNQTGQNTST